VISGFRREVDENRALLGYFAANSGNFLPGFRNNLPVPGLLTLEDGMDILSRNVGKNYHCSLRFNPEERSTQTLTSAQR
jgi:hypothetical protein